MGAEMYPSDMRYSPCAACRRAIRRKDHFMKSEVISHMAKRKQRNYRAEQAHKRNLEQAEIRRKQKKQKEFLDKHGKTIAIASAAAVVVIVAVWLLCSLLIGPGGSIPNFFGTLQGVEDNWLITNTGSTSKPKYFKMGEFDAPEGYTLDPNYQATTDAKNQTFYFNADDENSAVKSVYVSGVANKTAAEMLETVVGYGYYASAEEAQTATIGGHDVHYAYFVYGDSNTATDTDLNGEFEYLDGYPSLCMYTDTVQDSCVLVLINGHNTAIDQVAPAADLLAEAEKILPMLTVEK